LPVVLASPDGRAFGPVKPRSPSTRSSRLIVGPGRSTKKEEIKTVTNTTRRLSGLLATTALVAWGCGDGAANPSAWPSTAEASVSGTVTSKGKPMSKGEVHFDSPDAPPGHASARSALDPKGHYSVKTRPGPNRVVVVIPGRKQPEMHAFEAKEGENSYDISLSP
jgi:hypothetical protein